MTADIIVRRLSIIKHLYKKGTDEANLPETISFSSILTLHDSIDMFMNLVAEKKGITKGLYLMEYFTHIAELTLKASVDRINKRRNALKHNGIIPGKIEIQDTCSVTKLFLEENAKIIFNKDFNTISLFDLISFDEVREFLKKSQSLIENDKIKDAASSIAKAYFHLLLVEDSHHKNKVKNPWYNSDPKPLIIDDKFYTKAFPIFLEEQAEMFKEPKTEDGYVEISEGVAAISYNNNQAFIYIFQSLRILSLGLDYRKYNHFNSFMPQVFSYSIEEKKYNMGVPIAYSKSMTIENITFALEFVMDFAFKLQEFKY